MINTNTIHRQHPTRRILSTRKFICPPHMVSTHLTLWRRKRCTFCTRKEEKGTLEIAKMWQTCHLRSDMMMAQYRSICTGMTSRWTNQTILAAVWVKKWRELFNHTLMQMETTPIIMFIKIRAILTRQVRRCREILRRQKFPCPSKTLSNHKRDPNRLALPRFSAQQKTWKSRLRVRSRE